MQDTDHLSNFYRLYRVVTDKDNKGIERVGAGSFAILDNEVYILSDPHGWVRQEIGFGPVNEKILHNIHRMRNSHYFELVSEDDIKHGAIPSLLPVYNPIEEPGITPEVNISDKKNRQPSAWHYYRLDEDEPSLLEYKDGKLLFNGFDTTPSEQQWILHSLKSGAASLKYFKNPVTIPGLAKMESLLKAMDPPKPEDESKYEFDNILKSNQEKEGAAHHLKFADTFENKVRPLYQSGAMDEPTFEAIRRAAFEDPMVPGIGNKSSYYTHLYNVANKRLPGTWINIDANNFKAINDELSHPHGDEAIRMFGQAFRRAVDRGIGSDNAKIHRPGGDEFSIWVNEQPGESPQDHNEKVQSLLRDLQSETENSVSEKYPELNASHRLSFSAGVGKSPMAAETQLQLAKQAKAASGQPPGQQGFHFSIHPHVQAKAPPQEPEGDDKNFTDPDPWVEAKYRRGGEKELNKWFDEDWHPDLDEEGDHFTEEPESGGITKSEEFLLKEEEDDADSSTSKKNIFSPNEKYNLTELYRSYKNSPHNPRSLFLKYLIYRIENPQLDREKDQEWLDFHHHPKNEHISLWDLESGRTKNPELSKKLINHQKRLHNYIKKFGMVKDINSEPHVSLARGLKTPEMGRNHQLSSWTDIPHVARGFGNYVHNYNIPLKNLWYSFDAGPQKATSAQFGNEDEFLVSPGNWKETYFDDENPIKQIVPRARHDMTKVKPWETIKHRLVNDDPTVTSHEIDQVMDNHPALMYDSTVLTKLASHPNISEEGIDKILSRSPGGVIEGLLAKNPAILEKHLQKLLDTSYINVLESVIQNPKFTPAMMDYVVDQEYLNPEIWSAMARSEHFGPKRVDRFIDMLKNRKELFGEKTLGSWIYAARHIADHPAATPKHIEELMRLDNPLIQNRLISNPKVPVEILEHFALDKDTDFNTKFEAIKNPNASRKMFEAALVEPNGHALIQTALKNPNFPSDLLDKVLDHPSSSVASEAAIHPSLTDDQLNRALNHKYGEVQHAAVNNPKFGPKHAAQIVNGSNEILKEYLKAVRPIDYAQAVKEQKKNPPPTSPESEPK